MKKRSCTILLKDEVNCSILGLDDEHLKLLKKKFSILVPTRFYNAKFKLGVWDGTIAFFTLEGSTYINLLDEIVPILTGYNYKIKVDDKRLNNLPIPDEIDENYWKDTIEYKGSPLVLREHQVRVINKLTREGSGIGEASTSSGKTLMTGTMTKIYEDLDDLRVLTIVPNKTLVRQTHTDYMLLNLDAGIFYGDKKETNHMHLVSTWQSLKNAPHMMKDYDVVIVDEVHQAKGAVLQELLNKHGRNIPYRFGVTGTMPKEDIDLMAIRVAIGEVLVSVKARELIDKKIVSNLDIEIYELEHNFETEYAKYKRDFTKTLSRPTPLSYMDFKYGYLPDWTSEKNYNQQHTDHINWVANKLEIASHAYGNVLCLVDGVKHGQRLCDATQNGLFLSGKDSAKTREQIYQRYQTEDGIILYATAQIASTGLSIDRIFLLGFVNFGKSGIKVIQSIGRGLRMGDDKDRVKVYDFTNDLKFSRRHTGERIKFYKEAEYPYSKQKIKFSDMDNDLFA